MLRVIYRIFIVTLIVVAPTNALVYSTAKIIAIVKSFVVQAECLSHTLTDIGGRSEMTACGNIFGSNATKGLNTWRY